MWPKGLLCYFSSLLHSHSRRRTAHLLTYPRGIQAVEVYSVARVIPLSVYKVISDYP